MTNENKQKQFIPCDCPKGGVYSDGQVCQKCGGTEYIEKKQSWEERFEENTNLDMTFHNHLMIKFQNAIHQEIINKAKDKWGIIL